jgi:hypothetical protein
MGERERPVRPRAEALTCPGYPDVTTRLRVVFGERHVPRQRHPQQGVADGRLDGGYRGALRGKVSQTAE